MLKIKNLSISVGKKEIIKNLELNVEKGKIYALMGPNGSGKSTLANALAGNPNYKITKGNIILDGIDITNASPDERAKHGLFLSFQYPQEIDGVTITNFLRHAYNATHQKKLNPFAFKKLIKEKQENLNVNEQFTKRYLNKGFSGGEKKKSEMLQMLILDPRVVILDETDSGLDIDALRTIARAIKKFMTPEKTCIIITHYQRILDYLEPDEIIIMKKGKIVKTGKKELAKEIEKKGYQTIS